MQAPGRVRIVQDELGRRGEVLNSPGQPVRAGRCRPHGPVAVSGLRPCQRLRQVLDPGRQHEVSLAATQGAAHPPVMGFARLGPRLLQRDPGQVDERPDVELAEHLA
jgi:hypothetical protein